MCPDSPSADMVCRSRTNDSMSPEPDIRAETTSDHEAVDELLQLAFETTAEANLVRQVRAVLDEHTSLVLVSHGQIRGHILLTPVSAGLAEPSVPAVGLGPLAVRSDSQGRGFGSQLVQAAIDASRAQNQRLMFVLGHPEYYRRFGFELACHFDLHYRSSEFDPWFMVLALVPGALEGISGPVHYHRLFDAA